MLALAWAVFVGLLLAKAWVCDDAYITFRVVDNFVEGHGLTWNVDERVQVYTHPLWMLLHVPLYASTGNIFLTTIALSVLLVMGALYLVVRTTRASAWVILAGLLLPLVSSRAFMDYTTSGLENPGSFVLLALFGYLVMQERVALWPPLFVASLAVVNRPDALLLYLPVLVDLFMRAPNGRRWRDLVGLLPLASWAVFALVYYGTPLPNTTWAKLATGVSTVSYIRQGFRYVVDLMVNDTPSFALIVLGISLGIAGLMATGHRHSTTASRRAGFLALGVCLYVGYVVWIGGDFMAGRFFALPVFAAVWILRAQPSSARRELLILSVLLASVVLVQIPERRVEVASYIDDQRAKYAGKYSLFSFDHGELFLRRGLADHSYLGQHGDFLARSQGKRGLVVRGATGIYGFYAGPGVIVVDNYALTDALLARLPWKRRAGRFTGLPIGHFPRGKPEGYLRARATGSTAEIQPDLREYYEELRLITSGPIWSAKRLWAIARFNFGMGSERLERYVRTHYEATEEVPGGHDAYFVDEQGFRPVFEDSCSPGPNDRCVGAGGGS